MVRNARDSRVSIHHCAALGLLRGRAGVAEFETPVVEDPALSAFRAKVTAALNAARLCVFMADIYVEPEEEAVPAGRRPQELHRFLVHISAGSRLASAAEKRRAFPRALRLDGPLDLTPVREHVAARIAGQTPPTDRAEPPR